MPAPLARARFRIHKYPGISFNNTLRRHKDRPTLPSPSTPSPAQPSNTTRHRRVHQNSYSLPSPPPRPFFFRPASGKLWQILKHFYTRRRAPAGYLPIIIKYARLHVPEAAAGIEFRRHATRLFVRLPSRIIAVLGVCRRLPAVTGSRPRFRVAVVSLLPPDDVFRVKPNPARSRRTLAQWFPFGTKLQSPG